MKQYLSYSQEVLEAKEKGLPIVALESTIISHGMPYPQDRKRRVGKSVPRGIFALHSVLLAEIRKPQGFGNE